MKELDILEREVLKAIERCSVFSISEIKSVYAQCNSFDKTIEILRKSSQNKIEPIYIQSFNDIKSKIIPKNLLDLEEKGQNFIVCKHNNLK